MLYRSAPSGRVFLFKWTLANTAGWALGLAAGCVGYVLPFVALMAADSLIPLRLGEVSRAVLGWLLPGATGGAFLGACVGWMQQLVLRPYLSRPRQWIWASVAAGAVGGAAGCTVDFVAGLTAGGAVGLIVGFAVAGGLQYRNLRERVARASWWAITNVAGGAAAFVVDAGAVMAITALAVQRASPNPLLGPEYARQMDAAIRQVGQMVGVTLGTILGAALLGVLMGAVLMVLLRIQIPGVADLAAAPVVEKDDPAH